MHFQQLNWVSGHGDNATKGLTLNICKLLFVTLTLSDLIKSIVSQILRFLGERLSMASF